MNIDMRRAGVRLAAGLGLLAATAMSGGRWTQNAAAREEAMVANWPEASRRMVQAMIEKNGPPDRRRSDELTWLGLYEAKRTVIHRDPDGSGLVEMAVNYRVPENKIAELQRFEPRLHADRGAAELSVRVESVSGALLTLNLAHEIASGFRSADSARTLRDKQLRLADAGKASPYRERLLFEGELPVVVPFRQPVLPGEERAVPNAVPFEARPEKR